MRDWILVVAVGLGTYALRACLVVTFGRAVTIDDRVTRGLDHLAPAALAALLLPGLLVSNDRVIFDPPVVLAAIVAGIVAWRTRRIPAVLVSGLVVHQLASWLW